MWNKIKKDIRYRDILMKEKKPKLSGLFEIQLKKKTDGQPPTGETIR